MRESIVAHKAAGKNFTTLRWSSGHIEKMQEYQQSGRFPSQVKTIMYQVSEGKCCCKGNNVSIADIIINWCNGVK